MEGLGADLYSCTADIPVLRGYVEAWGASFGAGPKDKTAKKEEKK